MAEWKDIKDTAKRVAKGTARKTEELAQSAKLSLKLTAAKTKRDAAYEKLGRLTYKQLKSSVSQAEQISEVIATIDTINADISAIEKTIADEKAKKAAEKEAAKEEESSEEV